MAEVEVKDGKAKVTGDCRIAGVPGTGSKIMLEFCRYCRFGDWQTASHRQCCRYDRYHLQADIEASIVDCANPMVFVRAEDMGIKGTESPQEINSNAELLSPLGRDSIHELQSFIGMARTPARGNGEKSCLSNDRHGVKSIRL